MILAMLFMVLCFIPVMMIYSNDEFLKGGFGTASFDKIGIVNLGQAETHCIFHYLGIRDEQELKCKKGRISEIKTYGLQPGTGTRKLTGFHDWCGSNLTRAGINECTKTYMVP